MSEKPVSLVEYIREGYKCESPIPEERGPGSTEWMACGGCWPCLALQAAQGMEQAESHLQAALEALRPFARVHAGAETARRVLVGAIEGPDRFHDPVVVVFLQDVLDALDGGSRRQGLLAMGDTPEERIAKGRRILAAQEKSEQED